MTVQVNGHHIEITPALKQYVDDKIVHRLTKKFDNITNIYINLQVENNTKIKEHVTKVELHIPNMEHLFATHTSEDMYKSIDEVAYKLEKQIDKQQ